MYCTRICEVLCLIIYFDLLDFCWLKGRKNIFLITFLLYGLGVWGRKLGVVFGVGNGRLFSFVSPVRCCFRFLWLRSWGGGFHVLQWISF